jgi:hypothetical protein
MTDKFNKLYKEIIQESSLSRVWAKTQKHTCGSITAFRGEKKRAENLRDNKKMLAYLQSKGYSVTFVLGTYIENRFIRDPAYGFLNPNKKMINKKAVPTNEESFFVCNHNVEGDDGGELERDLFKLGEAYNQDSVLIIPFGGQGAYLLGTSDRPEAYPGYEVKEIVGKGKYGKTAGEFLSKIGGREFAFEEISLPQTINGIRGMKILLKEVKQDLNE